MRLDEAHHRIANDLAVVASALRLKALAIAGDATLTPAEVKLALLDAAGQVDVVGRLHRTLCSVDLARVADAYLQAVCADLSLLAADHGAAISYAIAFDGDVPEAALRPLGLLLHELVVNAVKHARPEGGAAIAVTCTDTDDGRIALDVIDNGAGLPTAFDPARDGGIGFKLMRELANQLDATLTFEATPDGAAARLRGNGPLTG